MICFTRPVVDTKNGNERKEINENKRWEVIDQGTKTNKWMHIFFRRLHNYIIVDEGTWIKEERRTHLRPLSQWENLGKRMKSFLSATVVFFRPQHRARRYCCWQRKVQKYGKKKKKWQEYWRAFFEWQEYGHYFFFWRKYGIFFIKIY